MYLKPPYSGCFVTRILMQPSNEYLVYQGKIATGNDNIQKVDGILVKDLTKPFSWHLKYINERLIYEIVQAMWTSKGLVFPKHLHRKLPIPFKKVTSIFLFRRNRHEVR